MVTRLGSSPPEHRPESRVTLARCSNRRVPRARSCFMKGLHMHFANYKHTSIIGHKKSPAQIMNSTHTITNPTTQSEPSEPSVRASRRAAPTMYAVPGEKRQQSLRKTLPWKPFQTIFLPLVVACSSAARSGKPCPPLDLRPCCMSPERPF